jgi:hypothetical protein
MAFKGGTPLNVSAAKKITDWTDTDGEVHYDIVWAAHSYTKSAIKRYHNCLMQLAGINGLARDLMDWLVIQMNNANVVMNTDHHKSVFIEYLEDAKVKYEFDYKIPSRRSIDRAFALLTKRRLLIPVKRSVYMVNPEYFMSTRNEKSRKVLIQMVLEFDYGTHTKMQIIRKENEKKADRRKRIST